jgi:(heptosyl)LPS beta-1,4-glucosyltransferase
VPISAVIITRNEERNIDRCLRSLHGIADEVIVVDAESTDATREIAGSHGARVHVRPWTGYSDQKNFANGLAQHDHILSLDADEALSEALREDLLRRKREGLSGAFRVKRLTNYCGHWVRHGGWYPDAKVRLFPKEGTVWQGDHVHEELVLPLGCTVTELHGDLLHYSYHSVQDHLERIERYSTLHARALHARGKHAPLWRLWLAPAFKFVQGYLLLLGFVDGWAGWRIAWLSARAVRLKYSKLRQLQVRDAQA